MCIVYYFSIKIIEQFDNKKNSTNFAAQLSIITIIKIRQNERYTEQNR